MKKFFLIIMEIIFLTFFCISPSIVHANVQTDMNTQTNAFVGANGAQFSAPQDPRIIVARLVLFVLTLVGTLFVAYTVYAGYLILTSAGNDDQINKGKSTIRTATIGVIVTLSAYAIVTFVTRALLGANQPSPNGFFYGSAGVTTQARDVRNPSNDPYASPDGVPYVPTELNQSTR